MDVELDLYFQVWRSEINVPKNYSIKLLLEAYSKRLTKEEFYYYHVYLPF
jgi:hypothetical protein